MTRTAVVILALVLVSIPALASDGRPDVRVSLDLNDVDVRSALIVLFKSGGAQYTIDSTVDGTLGALSFKDVEFETALKQIAKSAGLVYRLSDGTYNVSKRTDPVPVPVAQPPVDVVPVATEPVAVQIEKVALSHSDAQEIMATLNEARGYSGVATRTAGSGMVPSMGGMSPMGGMVPMSGRASRSGYPMQQQMVPGGGYPMSGMATRSRGVPMATSQPLIGGLAGW